jgi:hypothetical protein
MYVIVCKHCRKAFLPKRKNNIYCSKSCKTGAYLKKNNNKAKQLDDAVQDLQTVREELEQIVKKTDLYRTNNYLQEIFVWCITNIGKGTFLGLDYLGTYEKMEAEYLADLEKYDSIKAYVMWRDKYSSYYPSYEVHNFSISTKIELREWEKNNLPT